MNPLEEKKEENMNKEPLEEIKDHTMNDCHEKEEKEPDSMLPLILKIMAIVVTAIIFLLSSIGQLAAIVGMNIFGMVVAYLVFKSLDQNDKE